MSRKPYVEKESESSESDESESEPSQDSDEDVKVLDPSDSDSLGSKEEDRMEREALPQDSDEEEEMEEDLTAPLSPIGTRDILEGLGSTATGSSGVVAQVSGIDVTDDDQPTTSRAVPKKKKAKAKKVKRPTVSDVPPMVTDVPGGDGTARFGLIVQPPLPGQPVPQRGLADLRLLLARGQGRERASGDQRRDRR